MKYKFRFSVVFIMFLFYFGIVLFEALLFKRYRNPKRWPFLPP